MGGAISAAGVQGGQIIISNLGTGGFFAQNLSVLSVASSGGSGGQITLSSPSGVFVAAPGTLSADAAGSGDFGGGFISLTFAAMQVLFGLSVSLSANGVNGGSGGFVSVTLTGADSTLTVGLLGSRIGSISATGGDTGTPTGDGGSVTLSAPQDVVVDISNIDAGPKGTNGSGARYDFTAGGRLSVLDGDLDAGAVGDGIGGTVDLQAGGNLFVEGSILAHGSGTGGNGGSITVVSGSFDPFMIGAGATANGVQGVIDASAGATDGNGGTISITSNGPGGVVIEDPADLKVGVMKGTGGSISVTAAGGPLRIGFGTLSADAAGTGFNASDFAGGTISLQAPSIEVTGGGELRLSANGSDTGSGGTITVEATGSNSDVLVGFDDEMLNFSATSGLNGGNGGTVTISSGADMAVFDELAIKLNPLGANGNGGTLTLSVAGGNPCCGSLFFEGDLELAGTGSGSLGTANITINTPLLFTIGEEETAGGITGSVLANIDITNKGTGGLRTNGAAISGDELTFKLSGGTLTIGGTIVADNVTMDLGGGVLATAGGLIDVSGECVNGAGGEGGTITINAASMQVLSGAGPLILIANGDDGHKGGQVSINFTSSTQDIVIGDSAGEFIIQANGGEIGSISGDGGSITLSAGRDVVVVPGFLSVTPLGNSGGGGTLDFTAGRNLFVTDDIDVSGVGFGNGGSVTLTSQSTGTFRILPGATVHGVNGSITAGAGPDGGNGGSINLIFPAGTVQVAGGSGFSADAAGNSLAFNGGSITLNAFVVDTTGPGPIFLSANGSGLGNGGSVTVAQTGANQNLTVGSGDGEFIISVSGDGDGGSGGNVSLGTPGNLIVNPAFLTAGPNGSNGDGAALSFTTITGVVLIDGDLTVSGVGVGDGGSVLIHSAGAGTFDIGPGAVGQGVNGSIEANGGIGGGSGGIVSITAGGPAGTIRFDDGGDIFADATGADGDSQTFSGGAISLTASRFEVRSDAHVSFSANGASSGNGGAILVITTGAGGADIEIGFDSGQIDVSATGGSSNSLAGNGGFVDVSATNLVVDASALLVGPLGDAGNGPRIHLTAGVNEVAGNLFVPGSLSADAAGDIGAGGTIILSSNGPEFIVGTGAGATVNGVDGSLSAKAGPSVGNGGTVTIVNAADGGITLGSGGAPNVTGGSRVGNGGKINLLSDGLLSFTDSILAAPANASLGGNGGEITLIGERIVGPAGNSLALLVPGSGIGNGGTIRVAAMGTAASDTIVVDTAAGGIEVNAQGGTSGSLAGDGGTVIIFSTRDLTVLDPSAISVDPQGLSGKGGTIDLTAGSGANTGNLFVAGNLNAGGVGIGDGGSISLTSNSSVAFGIDTGATVNGVDGGISASAQGTSGGGGSVTVTNRGSGGVELGLSPVFVEPSSIGGGNGGTINVSADHPDGDVVFNNASPILVANANAGSFSVGNFDGGRIIVSAGRAVVGAGTGVVSMSANALGTGQPGSVTLTTLGTGAASDISLGLDPGEFLLRARTVMLDLIALGTGGTVTVSSGRNVTVDPAGIGVGGMGGNVTGGTINLTAGSADSSGTLFVESSLAADGQGTGNGGSINITVNSSQRFNVFPGATQNGVDGSLSADAGPDFGNGGQVSITNLGKGGIGFDATPDIFVTASGNGGNGGTIDLSAPLGPIAFAGAGLNADASGAGNSDGGTINVSASKLVLPANANVNFSAIGSGTGTGGNVSIETTSKSFNLNVGTANGQLSVNAEGGFSLNGEGGTITISSGKNLTVDGDGLSVFSSFLAGGTMSLTAGTAGKGNFVLTGNDLAAGIGANDAINVTLAGKGKITRIALIRFLATTVNLSNPFGGIGTKSTPIRTESLFLTAVSSKSAFLAHVDAGSFDGVLLGASSANKTFQLVAEGDIGVTGNLNANKLNLVAAAGSDGGITVGANLTGTNTKGLGFKGTVTVDADGAGDILQLTGQLGGKRVTLVSDSGDIGSPNSEVFVTSGSAQKAVSVSASAVAGSAFINSLSPMTLKTATAGGTLEIESCGNLTASKTLTADEVVLAVGGASDGDIKAKVNANSVSVFAPNPGSNAFLTSVGSIDLGTSNVGGILQLKAPGNIDVGGGGFANVEAGSFRVFTTGDNGFIQINDDVHAQQQVILSTKGPNSEIEINEDLDMFADNGVMTLQTRGINSPIDLDSDDIDVFGDNSRVTLTTRGANSPIQLDDDIQTQGDNDVVTLQTRNATSPININDSVRAQGANTVVNMTAKSDIGGAGGTIEATTANLRTTGGFIDVDTDVDFITATAKGPVTIVENDGIVARSISAVGTIIVTAATGQLAVAEKGKISAKNGNIVLFNEDQFDGTIVVGQSAQIKAIAKNSPLGNVTIAVFETDDVVGPNPGNTTVVLKNGGQVFFGADSITALAPVNKLTAKGADIIFNTGPAQGPAAITLSGGVKITADPPGLLPASAGIPARSSDALTGGLILSADVASHAVLGSPDGGRSASPAPAGGLSAAPTNRAGKNELRLDQPTGAALQASMFSIPSASITRGIDTIPFVMPDDALLTPDGVLPMLNGAVVTPEGGRGASHAPAALPGSAGILPAPVTVTADADLQPVAYAPPAVRPGSAGGRAALLRRIGNATSQYSECSGGSASSAARFSVETTQSGGTVVKHACAQLSFDGADVVSLTDGEVLISSSRNSVVRAGRHYVVTVASGAMALVSMQNATLKVRNVYEGLHSPVRVLVDGRSVDLSAGQEFIVSRDEASLKQAMRDDNIGRRRVKSFIVDGEFKVVRADVSLVSLLQRSDVLARIATSKADDDKSIAAKLMKMAACLMQVTSGRGAYSVADPAKVTSEEIKTPRRFHTVADARL